MMVIIIILLIYYLILIGLLWRLFIINSTILSLNKICLRVNVLTILFLVIWIKRIDYWFILIRLFILIIWNGIWKSGWLPTTSLWIIFWKLIISIIFFQDWLLQCKIFSEEYIIFAWLFWITLLSTGTLLFILIPRNTGGINVIIIN